MSATGPWIECRSHGVARLGRELEAALTDALEPLVPPPRAFLEIEGMSGWRYRLLINSLVRRVPNARYMEVGVWKGSTFCSAIAGNEVRAVAVDNWSQFGGPKDEFLTNVERFVGPEVRFVERDFRNLDFARQGRFNIYMFDGPHEEADQRDGVSLALPALDDDFVLVIDDWNWPAVRSGTQNAIGSLGLREVFALEVRTTQDDTHPLHSGFDAGKTEWHNGYYIGVLRKRQSDTKKRGEKRAGLLPRVKSMPASLRAKSAAKAHARSPEDTEVLALITHHHDRSRLPWLKEVVSALASWPAHRIEAVVVTDTAASDDLSAIVECAPVEPSALVLRTVTARGLDHAHDLPWAQKPIVEDRFVSGVEGFTHLVSIEDDIAVPADAYRYWLRYRPLLPQGLIPSFVRVEFRSGDDTPYATDSPRPNRLEGRRFSRVGAFDFIALDKPYSAMFMMDRALADEYAESSSFDQGASMAISPWRTRERAAMGLCWESPPWGFPVRHVVPVETSTRSLASCAFAIHLPGNYARDPESPFGKVPAKNVLA